MWRLQVWEGKHIVEAFLFDTEEEAKAKKGDLQNTYFPPKYTLKVEKFRKFRLNRRWKRISSFVEAILEAISLSSH